MPRSPVRRAWTRRRRRRLGAALLVLLSIAPRPAVGDRPQQVVVAARTLDAGHRIDDDDLRTVPWPAADRPDQRGRLIGRVVRDRILEGEPIRVERLGGRGGATAELLRAGERAVHLPTEVPGVGVLQAQDGIDLVERVDGGPRTLARAARVLRTDSGGAVVAVEAEAGGAVAAAALSGTLVLLVRPPP